MSHDLVVSFSRWPKDALDRWIAELARMGVDATFHPDFDPVHDTAWCPVVLHCAAAADLPISKKLREFGAFETGFEYYPEADSATFTSTRTEGTLAAFVCGAALAAALRGVVRDTYDGSSGHGATGLEVLEAFYPEGTLLDGPAKPRKFRSWDEGYEDDAVDEGEDKDEDDPPLPM